ncbi:MAG: hypothetical protein JWM68_3347 [Verrucomicrobiales bacterium]|nr:hypothetical protein [Verrucomicrobiales bacterium]
MSNDDSALDQFARFIQVVGSNLTLRQWFWGLSGISSVQRRNEISAMIQKMMARGEDADLIAVVALLTEDSVFEASCQALRECGYS